MTQNDILITAGVGIITGVGGFIAGILYTKHKYGLDDIDEEVQEFVFGDTDGDYFIVNEPETERPYTSIDKPDIFEIGQKVVEDYSKFAEVAKETVEDAIAELAPSKIDTEIEIERENIFDTAERSSIVSENTAKDLVADGYDTLTATYFPSDDILAGFDDKLDQLDEGEYGLEEAVNAIMNSENMNDSVFVRNDDEQIVYEVVVSHVPYEEAIEEVE